MKALILNPPNRPFTEKSLLIEPIDMLASATAIKEMGVDVVAIDMDVKRMTAVDLEKEFALGGFDIMLIIHDYHIPLFTSESIEEVLKISALAKKNGIQTFIAGKSAKHNPARFLENGFDAVINGEVEPVFNSMMEKGFKLDENIKGITFLSDGKMVTSIPSMKVDIQAIPIPDRSLVDLEDYIDVRTMQTSRGCDGRCSFCATPGFWGAWRGRTAEQVVEEIKHLIKTTGTKKILFIDDNATVDIDRMKEISKILIAEDLDCTFGCLGSARTFDEEMFILMSKAGFRWIHFGAESGCNEVLKSMGKGVKAEQLERAVILAKEAGLRVRTSWIFDFPGMDKEALRKTAELIMRIKPDEIRAHFLVRRPGSIIGKDGDVENYIHKAGPQGNGEDAAVVTSMINELVSGLAENGFDIINDMADWKKEKEDMKFISFCPARYGIGWRR